MLDGRKHVDIPTFVCFNAVHFVLLNACGKSFHIPTKVYIIVADRYLGRLDQVLLGARLPLTDRVDLLFEKWCCLVYFYKFTWWLFLRRYIKINAGLLGSYHLINKSVQVTLEQEFAADYARIKILRLFEGV